MIIATADSNASMGSIHIVDTVNYSNVYQEFTVDLDNVPTNASRVVFYVVPEFVSGYTYAYTYAYLDDIEIRDIPNCPIALNASGNATSDSSVTLLGQTALLFQTILSSGVQQDLHKVLELQWIRLWVVLGQSIRLMMQQPTISTSSLTVCLQTVLYLRG